MKTILLATALLFAQQTLSAQSAMELIEKVYRSQENLRTATYKLSRWDTLVTGDTRAITGSAKIRVNPADTIFGFAYWGKRDDLNQETIYDGTRLVEVNHDKKMYRLQTSPAMFEHSLGQPGGQIIFPDLIRLDTSDASGYHLTEDTNFYYLTIHRHDLKEHDVLNRYRKLTIDKKLLLPVAMNSHQEYLGKAQDLHYVVREVHINEESYAYNFNDQWFPGDYLEDKPKAQQISPLLNKAAPAFKLKSFGGDTVDLNILKGKVVLLDFWEVWCGPCIASMPKVDSLYKQYKGKGLEVYGIANDEKHIESSKLLVQKRKVTFPNLTGNTHLKTSYGINGVPFYVLIDRKGMVVFAGNGYTKELEEAINKLL